ncbi:ABC transporter ATP-binding protein uup [Rosistilla oblonga]|uniref:ATP-binding cassette domain-containing protein n=1 Tax=Rosistilla oblonga TaxID=2527990 RepID=UPI00118D326D|nr:ATP-binding cassette domain-containing protein [Rosistilla oblonga]QDV14396.1 ABC transporter ATP-binding protein uup [Rosistilla oblonga]
MALISLQNITIGFRGPSLLDDVNCQIEAGGRIGLLGRNGAGKSTLLKMLRGGVLPDHGSIILSPGTRVAYLQQDVPSGTSETVAEVTAKGLGEEFHLQENAWEAEHLVEQTLSRMELDGEALFETLSSGMKRRVLLAQAIVSKPQLLLLDEPTNHLDIEAIGWLEGFLAKWPGTLIFVTHDRMFLRKVATRILEIDRGQLFDWSCDYDTFLRRKEEALAAQEKQDALFDKKLAQEEVWIRQGIKARRTRNEGRVRALEKLRETRSQRRGATGTVQMQVQAAERSGNLVTEVKDVSFEYPDRPILKNFSTSIMRGDKIGIIGPNGVGKTTMLKILLGQLEPQSGTVRTGTNLQIAYFDQLRDQLDEEETIQENVGLGHTQIVINGREKHIIGYLQDFLFSPERARTQVKFLSGGERNRVLLARLFANPANVIVLDEPTNDLDAETLEMLEDKLVGYDGTLLLVSHDRAFLNNVVTSTIVYEPDGVKEYVGGYDDWLAQRGPLPTATTESSSAGGSKSKSKGKAKADPEPAKKRLSYKQQRELDGLPAKIETLEGQIAEIHQTIADPSFYQGPGERIAEEQRKLKDLEQKLADTYARWEELEGT